MRLFPGHYRSTHCQGGCLVRQRGHEVTKDYAQVSKKNCLRLDKIDEISCRRLRFWCRACRRKFPRSPLLLLWIFLSSLSRAFTVGNVVALYLRAGTNTFAMPANKISKLQPVMDEFTGSMWLPSVLRLLYTLNLLNDLIINQRN